MNSNLGVGSNIEKKIQIYKDENQKKTNLYKTNVDYI